MKKAIYIATCLLGLTISSCSDFLEQENRSDVPSNEFYNTKTGFNSLLNSTYSSKKYLRRSSLGIQCRNRLVCRW